MRKYTQREIKNLVADRIAEDITRCSFSEIQELRAAASLEKVGYSSGTYGINGGVLKNQTSGKLYAITARTSALFQIF